MDTSDTTEYALYESSKGTLSKKDFVQSLKDTGIVQGDVIFVHSDITSFGKLATHDRQLLLQSFIDALKEVVGKNGVIIMPTFTYSFDKNEAYNKDLTKSTVGVLTDYFCKQEDVVRTVHPSHSAAIWGSDKEQFASVGKSTFDDESIFGKFHFRKGKLVFLGTNLGKACTFIHYIEQKKSVPYRYMKKIKCNIIENEKAYEDIFWFYYKYSFFFTDMIALENHVREKGHLKEATVGDGVVQTIDSASLLQEGLAMLDKNVFSFLKDDSYFKIFNRIMLPFLKFARPLVKLLDLIAIPILRK